jgi:hypothetical protein
MRHQIQAVNNLPTVNRPYGTKGAEQLPLESFLTLTPLLEITTALQVLAEFGKLFSGLIPNSWKGCHQLFHLTPLQEEGV